MCKSGRCVLLTDVHFDVELHEQIRHLSIADMPATSFQQRMEMTTSYEQKDKVIAGVTVHIFHLLQETEGKLVQNHSLALVLWRQQVDGNHTSIGPLPAV